MELYPFFKSVMEQDVAPIVLCRTDHTVLYMNSAAAKRYAGAGGYALVGNSIMQCHGAYGAKMIEEVVSWFAESTENNIMFESRNDAENKDVYMVALRADDGSLIGYYEKHEYRSAESSEPYAFG